MKVKESTWQVPEIIDLDFPKKTIPREILEIMYRRGFRNNKEIEEFLYPSKPPDPLKHFPDLNKAIDRILLSYKEKKKIAICGDYDADGMTSTALLFDILKQINANVIAIIPSREDDGYGLNKNIVEDLIRKGVDLIVTVDNGVSAIEALDYSHNKKLDVIITDHHVIKEKLENVYALIHPSTTPKDSPYKFLAGVGLAYIVAIQIARKVNDYNSLRLSNDLLCIGTVADMALLKGANRYWLKNFIPEISNTVSIGLRRLLNKANVRHKNIRSEDISFKIAPRINSVGRIDDPNLVLEFFLENDKEKAYILADRCESINKQRRHICNKSVEEAFLMLDKANQADEPFILLSNLNWHHGIIGLIASRVKEKYSKPVAILSKDTEGFYRGSIRSDSSFNVIKALEYSSKYLEKFGGHQCAGGFTVKSPNIELLKSKLIDYSKKYDEDGNQIKIKPEVYINFNDIDENLLKFLHHMEPFGNGNPKPIFWTRECEVIEKKYSFSGQLSLQLVQNGCLQRGVQWSTNKDIDIRLSSKIDIAYNIDFKTVSNQKRIELNILGIKKTCSKELLKIGDREYLCYFKESNILCIENNKGNKIYYDINKSIIINDNELLQENIYIKKLIYLAKSTLGVLN